MNLEANFRNRISSCVPKTLDVTAWRSELTVWLGNPNNPPTGVRTLLFGNFKETITPSIEVVLQLQAYQHPHPNKVILESVPLTR
jgi:hypothetical protein